MKPDPKTIARLAREITQKLAKEGKIIEGGWVGYRMLLSPTASQVQIDETRMAFYGGAHHLFASIMTILEPGAEATEKDMDALTLINKELEVFLEEYKRKHGIQDRP